MSLFGWLFGEQKPAQTSWPALTPSSQTAAQTALGNLASWAAGTQIPYSFPWLDQGVSLASQSAASALTNVIPQLTNYANEVAASAGRTTSALNQMPRFVNAVTAQDPRSVFQKLVQVPGLQPASYTPSGMLNAARGDITRRIGEGAGTADAAREAMRLYGIASGNEALSNAKTLAHRFAGQRGSNVGAVVGKALADADTQRQLQIATLMANLASQDASARSQATGQAMTMEQIGDALSRMPAEEARQLMSLAVTMSGQDFGQRLSATGQAQDYGFRRLGAEQSSTAPLLQAASILGQIPGLEDMDRRNKLQVAEYLRNAAATEPALLAQVLSIIRGAATAPFQVSGTTGGYQTPNNAQNIGTMLGWILPFL